MSRMRTPDCARIEVSACVTPDRSGPVMSMCSTRESENVGMALTLRFEEVDPAGLEGVLGADHPEAVAALEHFDRPRPAAQLAHRRTDVRPHGLAHQLLVGKMASRPIH